jgi:hypothetical protein
MKTLTTSELVSHLKDLLAQECAITVRQVEHLEEVDRRGGYFDYGYSTLWDFMIHELGLSLGSAQRRRDAMRLVRDLPSVKENLRDGSLTLTNAAKVQSFRRHEKKRGKVHDPGTLVNQVANLSQDDCTRKLYEISPHALPDERLRVVAPGARELKLIVSEELCSKFERIKGLLAHAQPGMNYTELLEYLAEKELNRLEKARGLAEAKVELKDSQRRATSPDSRLEPTTLNAPLNQPMIAHGEVARNALDANDSLSAHDAITKDLATVANPNSSAPPVFWPRAARRRVPLPVALRRRVWREAGGKCQICASTYQLEIDHITPVSWGGTDARENLRLLCRTHNQMPRFEPDPWEDFREFA